MNDQRVDDSDLNEAAVRAELQRRPTVLLQLAENSLTVAEGLRGNYFPNTARFVTDVRRAMRAASQGKRANSPLVVHKIGDIGWHSVANEVVTFIDGGVGRVQFASQMPILLRVGSYSVRTGERRLAEREQFGYYPVILGDLEGGSKERPDFVDIVRITAELLGGLAALERTPDLDVLFFHGPLVYEVGLYAGHTPFTEHDIDLFLHHYAADIRHGQRLKNEFLQEARLNIYPAMSDRSEEWVRRRLFEPLAWIAFLYRVLIREAKVRPQTPLIAGVVERGRLRDFAENIVLPRIFKGLREKDRGNYFSNMFGHPGLTAPKALLNRLGYTDALLMAMLLSPGDFSEAWEIDKYDSFRQRPITLPDEAWSSPTDFRALQPGPFGFPRVLGSYVCISETTVPIRIETFAEFGEDHLSEVAKRAWLYARLLPGYGFPVGLDIADKYAHVPTWMTDAYSKLIRYHLGVSLQRGEVNDTEMQRILIQAMYITQRDWLFRPQV